MAAISELQGACADYLCSNPASNVAHIYDDGCSAAEAASMLKSNLGTWEWHEISHDTIYTDETNNIFGGYGEGETMDEAIERIVKEVISKLTKEADITVVPEIEKYHIKHK